MFDRTAVSDIAWARTYDWRVKLASCWPGIARAGDPRPRPARRGDAAARVAARRGCAGRSARSSPRASSACASAARSCARRASHGAHAERAAQRGARPLRPRPRLRGRGARRGLSRRARTCDDRCVRARFVSTTGVEALLETGLRDGLREPRLGGKAAGSTALCQLCADCCDQPSGVARRSVRMLSVDGAIRLRIELGRRDVPRQREDGRRLQARCATTRTARRSSRLLRLELERSRLDVSCVLA